MTVEERVDNHEERITKIEDGLTKISNLDTTQPTIQDRSNSYNSNFTTHNGHNAIKKGENLILSIAGVDSIQGGIYQNGVLLLIGYSNKTDHDHNPETILFKLKHRKFKIFNYEFPVGVYVVKVTGYLKDGRTVSYEDMFDIFE